MQSRVNKNERRTASPLASHHPELLNFVKMSVTVDVKTPSSPDVAHRKSGSMMSNFVVCE